MPPTLITRLPYYVPADRKDRLGRTPLFQVVHRHEVDRARAYLNGGHRVNVKDRDGMYLLTQALHHQGDRGDPAMVRLLLDHAPRLDGPAGHQALTAAAWHGQLDLVQEFAARGVPLDGEDEDGENALTWATRAGRGPVVDWLLDQGVPVENNSPRTRRSALLTAVDFLGHLNGEQRADWRPRVNRLLAAGANPNRPGEQSRSTRSITPALRAVESNDLDLLERMIASPVGLDLSRKVDLTQVLGAVMMRPEQTDASSRAMFERVLALHPPLNAGAITGDDLPLSCALFDHYTPEEAEHRLIALLDAGADPMVRSAAGLSGLDHILAKTFNGRPFSERLRQPAFLDRLAACPTLDLDAQDPDGCTPLMRLVKHGKLLPQADLAARWLLDHGAAVNTVAPDGWTVLSSLVSALPNHVLNEPVGAKLLDVLLTQPIDWTAGRWPDQHDLCPGGFVAHQAIGRLPPALLARLVQAGMPLDQPDARGDTPLHRAVRLGQTANGHVLLHAGASVNALNHAGQRPHETVDPGQHNPLRDEVRGAFERDAMRQELDRTEVAPSTGRSRARL